MDAAVGSAETQELDERGFVVVPDALPRPLLGRIREAHDRVYAWEARAGHLCPNGSLHALGALSRDDAFLELVDLPATFPLVRAALGWNIYVYHSHVDAHPPQTTSRPIWRWHQDGGRQNVDLGGETTRPRLSVKVAYFLTDVLEPEDGAITVIPGSHLRNTLPRPKRPDLEFHDPAGATPVLVRAGTAVVFDRRLWHARGENTGRRVRKAVFLAYTYRWIRPREEPGRAVLERTPSPVRRQLLGEAAAPAGHWLPTPADVPVR